MIFVSTFYKFTQLNQDQLIKLSTELPPFAKENYLHGIIIIAEEGINGTVAGPEHSMNALKNYLMGFPGLGSVVFKDSYTDKSPFKRFKVRIKKEIVTSGVNELSPPNSSSSTHLSPTEWNKIIDEDPDAVILDVRNSYETELGKFKNALDPGLEHFSDFPNYVTKSGISKDKPILMYCTGGIRCEKAVLSMQHAGFENVFQLEGGILRYLNEYPNKYFDGECFVFDHRVAVKQDLTPTTTYRLCPHCGQPGTNNIVCLVCAKEAKVCTKCIVKQYNKTCSLNCGEIYRLKTQQALNGTT